MHCKWFHLWLLGSYSQKFGSSKFGNKTSLQNGSMKFYKQLQVPMYLEVEVTVVPSFADCMTKGSTMSWSKDIKKGG